MSVFLPGSSIFSTFNIKCVFSLQFLSEIDLIMKIIQRDITINVQGDQKISVHLMITIQKVTSKFKVSPASLPTFIDTPNCVLKDRVQYSTVMVGD